MSTKSGDELNLWHLPLRDTSLHNRRDVHTLSMNCNCGESAVFCTRRPRTATVESPRSAQPLWVPVSVHNEESHHVVNEQNMRHLPLSKRTAGTCRSMFTATKTMAPVAAHNGRSNEKKIPTMMPGITACRQTREHRINAHKPAKPAMHMPRAPSGGPADKRQHSAKCIVTSKTSIEHTTAVVDDEHGHFMETAKTMMPAPRACRQAKRTQREMHRNGQNQP